MSKKVTISPSQLANYLDCPRKWFFQTVLKLPDFKSPVSRDFGTCLHEVLERFYGADDSGRDENGLPVDLFPPGWEKVREFGRDTGRELNMQEQAIAKKLIAQAIEDGFLQRPPARSIERYVKIPVDDGVDIHGYIDVHSPGLILDHKTTKNPKWAMSAKKLSQDPKMLCYAVMEQVEAPGTPVTLRLDYYDKSLSKRPFKVETCLKPQRVIDFRSEVLEPSARHIRQSDLSPDDWAEVEGPRAKGACDAYGGCPFAKICSRVCTVDQYQNPEPKKKRTPEVAKFKKRPKFDADAAAPAPAPAPTPAPTTAPTPVAAPVPAPAAPAAAPADTGGDVPPWAVGACRACSGKGFNKTGAPCRACDVVSGRTGGRTSSEFETWVDDGGVTRWKEASGQDTTAPAPAPAAPVAPEAPPAPVATPTPPTPVEAKEDTVPATEEAEEGFTLYLGCQPEGIKTTSIAEIIHLHGLSFSGGFYSTNAFERRDRLADNAFEIAAGLGNGHIIAPAQLTPDELVLVAALRPLAKLVISA